MPPPPLVSPVTGSMVASQQFYIHADDSSGHFRDGAGRCLFLRGINLASNAKTPVGQPSQKLEGFWEGAESGDISFVNRVLDLDIDPKDDNSADTHLQRLRSWGFNTFRYVTTWESIEHRGPGQYDEEYLQYTIRMLRKCKEYGFLVYMDPHQDLWSRYSGGDGAPYWTLLACGMDPRNLTVTNAAVIQCEWPDPADPHAASFPDMIWASNYTRLAVMTLMTLFFAGKTYAPLCEIDGMNIQDYLQSHFLAAYRRLGEVIREAGDLYDVCVIGWDSMNEPNHGLVGLEDVTVQPAKNMLRIGPMPTAFEAMKLGMGHAVQVEKWKFGSLGAKRDGKIIIDPQGAKAWLDEEADVEYSLKYGWKRSSNWKAGRCIWALHGVWDPETLEVQDSDYFAETEGEHIDFGKAFWQPHWLAWARMIREVHPEAIHFVHPPVFEIPPTFKDDPDYMKALSHRAALSTHFYDGLTLITKHWNWFNADAVGLLRGKYASLALAIRVGEKAIRKVMRDQLGYLRQDTFDSMGHYPTMMGEIGIPYDLDKGKAYRTGVYANQSKALDASLNACDGRNLFNYTMWTYNSENSHRWGENWNGEDLSVWSPDDVQDVSGMYRPGVPQGHRVSTQVSITERSDDLNLNQGARAIEAFVRPYPTAVAGLPISIEFDPKTSVFTLVLETRPDDLKDGLDKLPTELYLPAIHYGYLQDDSGQESYTDIDQEFARNPRELAFDAPHLRFPWHRRPHRLELAVEVSRGYYELDGQRLKWYHRDDLPKDAGVRTERIRIQRLRGTRPEILSAHGVTTTSLLLDSMSSLCSKACTIA